MKGQHRRAKALEFSYLGSRSRSATYLCDPGQVTYLTPLNLKLRVCEEGIVTEPDLLVVTTV